MPSAIQNLSTTVNCWSVPPSFRRYACLHVASARASLNVRFPTRRGLSVSYYESEDRRALYGDFARGPHIILTISQCTMTCLTPHRPTLTPAMLGALPMDLEIIQTFRSWARLVGMVEYCSGTDPTSTGWSALFSLRSADPFPAKQQTARSWTIV